MKKVLPVRSRHRPLHSQRSDRLPEPWQGDECDEKFATVEITEVERIGAGQLDRFAEYSFIVRARDPNPNVSLLFTYLSTYDPRIR